MYIQNSTSRIQQYWYIHVSQGLFSVNSELMPIGRQGSAALPGTIGCHLVATQQGPCERIKDSRETVCVVSNPEGFLESGCVSTSSVTKLSEGSTLLSTDSCPTGLNTCLHPFIWSKAIFLAHQSFAQTLATVLSPPQTQGSSSSKTSPL